MAGDPLTQAYRPAKMAGRGVGDMWKWKMVLAALARLAGQACDNKKHIRHETPQHVNSFQKTYLLNTAVTANCCAVQQKCLTPPAPGPDLQRLEHGELDDLDDHDEGDGIGQYAGHVEKLEQHL
jgi:hypothetical protein